MDETVVVVVDPGRHVQVENSYLRGGLVIYAPPTYDYRSPRLNQLSVNSSIIGHGDQGIHNGIGIIAPGCQMYSGNSMEGSQGLFFLHDVRELNSVTIEGALFVVNDCLYLNSVEVSFNAEIFETSMPGMELPEAVGVHIKLVWESFPDHWIEGGGEGPYGGNG